MGGLAVIVGVIGVPDVIVEGIGKSVEDSSIGGGSSVVITGWGITYVGFVGGSGCDNPKLLRKAYTGISGDIFGVVGE